MRRPKRAPGPTAGRVRGRLRRGAYLLPSLLTTANLLLGFYAVVSGIQGRFERAAVVVFIAAFFDGLDGRLARLTGTESDFGREYDSLADLFTFGAAPALLAYLWGLGGFGRAGWLIPLFFMVCAAVRLARFNVQARVVDSRYFVGLPAPAAGGAISSLFFFAPQPETMMGEEGEWLRALVAVAVLGVGVLMVSTFRYWSLKQIDLQRRRSYRALAVLAALLLVLAYDPPMVILALATIYTLSGPVGWAVGRARGSRASSPAPEPQADEASPAESQEKP